MSAYVDLEFKYKGTPENGFYDWILNTQGGISQIEGLNTAIKMSILEEDRANDDEIPVPQNRRGWVGNAIIANGGFSIGGKLWLLDQAKLTANNINNGIDYLDNALAWLVNDGLAVSVKASLAGTTQGFPVYFIDVEVEKGVIKQFVFDLWLNTIEERII